MTNNICGVTSRFELKYLCSLTLLTKIPLSMANKTKHSSKNVKKQKGEYQKHREKTEYQRERDAFKKKRKGGNNGLEI